MRLPSGLILCARIAVGSASGPKAYNEPMRAVPLSVVLTAVAAAGQQAPPAARTPVGEPSKQAQASSTASLPPAASKVMARLRADLEAVHQNLCSAPHAYAGTLTVVSPANANLVARLEREFDGADDGNLAWYAMGDWCVVSRKQHVAVRCGERPWSQPQGDSPEVPLSPKLLAPHLLTATLSPPEPAEHEGRPALRVYAVWHGKPAKQLLMQTTVPSTQHEQVLEALASAVGKGRENLQVDATVLFDPASKRWLSTTLRFVCMDGRPIPEDEQPPTAPQGLPTLPSRPEIEGTWCIHNREFRTAKRPMLDARACQLLQIK